MTLNKWQKQQRKADAIDIARQKARNKRSALLPKPCWIKDCSREVTRWMRSTMAPGSELVYGVCGKHEAQILLEEVKDEQEPVQPLQGDDE